MAFTWGCRAATAGDMWGWSNEDGNERQDERNGSEESQMLW